MDRNEKDTEVFIALILRHHPELLNLKLDRYGYVDTDLLIEGVSLKGYNLTPSILDRIVLNNNKHRYKFNANKSKIRALQGHSIPVDLELLPQVPPKFLYHCTSVSSKNAIYIDGILKEPRQYVQLSANIETTSEADITHGKLLIFRVRALKMHNKNFKFYLNENNVWITEHIPSRYVEEFYG